MKERDILSEYLHETEKLRGLITTLAASWFKSNSACEGEGAYLPLSHNASDNSISLTFEKPLFNSFLSLRFYSVTGHLQEKNEPNGFFRATVNLWQITHVYTHKYIKDLPAQDCSGKLVWIKWECEISGSRTDHHVVVLIYSSMSSSW